MLAGVLGAGAGVGVVDVVGLLWSGVSTTGLGDGVVLLSVDGVGLLLAGGEPPSTAVGDGTGVAFEMSVDTGAD